MSMGHIILCTLPLVLKLAGSMHVCHPKDQCSCQFDDGLEINLWPIDQRGIPRFTNIMDKLGEAFIYSYNPCSSFTRTENVGQCASVLGCRMDEDGRNPVVIAYPSKPHVTYDDTEQRFTFTYSGSKLASGIVRKLAVTLNCEAKANIPRIESFLSVNGTTFTTTLTTEFACPEFKKMLSTEVIVCLVPLSLISVYCILGILFNKHVAEEEGTNTIPHKDFMVNAFKTGKRVCLFAIRRMRRKDSSYERI